MFSSAFCTYTQRGYAQNTKKPFLGYNHPPPDFTLTVACGSLVSPKHSWTHGPTHPHSYTRTHPTLDPALPLAPSSTHMHTLFLHLQFSIAQSSASVASKWTGPCPLPPCSSTSPYIRRRPLLRVGRVLNVVIICGQGREERRLSISPLGAVRCSSGISTAQEGQRQPLYKMSRAPLAP